jgi:hypothetical protein
MAAVAAHIAARAAIQTMSIDHSPAYETGSQCRETGVKTGNRVGEGA